MATQAEKDHHRARVTACNRCDQQGWRLDHGGRDGDRPLKCDHHGLATHVAADRDFSEPWRPGALS